MPASGEQDRDQRADCEQAEGEQRDEAAGGADLALDLAPDARAEGDTFGKSGFAATAHGQGIIIANDGLKGQALAVRGDASHAPDGRADRHDFDQAGRELSNL